MFVRMLSLGAALALAAPAVAADTPSKPVTFAKDVAPIFQAKCQECHQPNSIAPMSLISYEDARPWAASIKDRVSSRQMPPWHIDPSVGVQKFKNDMSLSQAQIDTIVRWIDEGALRGDRKGLRPVPGRHGQADCAGREDLVGPAHTRRWPAGYERIGNRHLVLPEGTGTKASLVPDWV